MSYGYNPNIGLNRSNYGGAALLGLYGGSGGFYGAPRNNQGRGFGGFGGFGGSGGSGGFGGIANWFRGFGQPRQPYGGAQGYGMGGGRSGRNRIYYGYQSPAAYDWSNEYLFR